MQHRMAFGRPGDAGTEECEGQRQQQQRREKANEERQRVGFEHETLQRDMLKADLALGSLGVSPAVTLRSVLGESPSCCQTSLGEVEPLRLPAIQTKL